MRFPASFLSRRSLASSVAVVLVVVFATGCATKRAYTGQPEKAENREGALTAWYIYDRGYTGNLETISTGEKLAFAPIMAFGELVSLGLGGWMTACAAPCQKGSLMVRYAGDGRVVGAVESFLPDDHPWVADCARSPVRADIGVCQGVREQVRPSSLPQTRP